MGKSEQPAVDLAKTFERRKCNHREAIPGNDCVTDVVGESCGFAFHSQGVINVRMFLRRVEQAPLCNSDSIPSITFYSQVDSGGTSGPYQSVCHDTGTPKRYDSQGKGIGASYAAYCDTKIVAHWQV